MHAGRVRPSAGLDLEPCLSGATSSASGSGSRGAPDLEVEERLGGQPGNRRRPDVLVVELPTRIEGGPARAAGRRDALRPNAATSRRRAPACSSLPVRGARPSIEPCRRRRRSPATTRATPRRHVAWVPGKSPRRASRSSIPTPAGLRVRGPADRIRGALGDARWRRARRLDLRTRPAGQAGDRHRPDRGRLRRRGRAGCRSSRRLGFELRDPRALVARAPLPDARGPALQPARVLPRLPGDRPARLFRDWLREHPDDLERYRDAKLGAAPRPTRPGST